MSVGSRIKEKREELRITQQELADKINCTKAAISNYEKNVSVPKTGRGRRFKSVKQLHENPRIYAVCKKL